MRRERKWPKNFHFNKILVVSRTWPDIAMRKMTDDVAKSFRIVILLFYHIIIIIIFYLLTRIAEESEKSKLLIYLFIYHLWKRALVQEWVCIEGAPSETIGRCHRYKRRCEQWLGDSQITATARVKSCSSGDRKPLTVRADLVELRNRSLASRVNSSQCLITKSVALERATAHD